MKKIIEIMLLGSSLRNLRRVGSADREVDYYSLFPPDYRITLFEYFCPDNAGARAGEVESGTLPIYFKSKLLQSTVGALLAAMRCKQPVIIRTKQFWGAWAGVVFKRVTCCPLIIRMGYIWSHNFILQRDIESIFWTSAIRLFEKMILSQADAIIYATPEIRDYFAYCSTPFEVIPNGVNNRKFSYRKTSQIYHLIYVGRLIEIRNIRAMICAIPDEYNMLIIGDGPEGSALDRHRDIQWIKKVPNNDLPFYMRAARCFISLSQTEGSPKAVLEAIFCGCYPILSDIPAHRRIIGELGYGSLVIPPYTKSEIETLVLNASIDPKRLLEFKRKYSMSRIVKREIDFMDSLLYRNT